jgi:glutaredoxin
VCVPLAGAGDASEDAAASTNDIVIELFMRGDSQQSEAALAYLDDLQQQREGIVVKSYDLLKDQAALRRLYDLARRFGRDKPNVPTIYLGDRMIVGFPDRATSGKQIEELLKVRVFVRPGCRHCHEAQQFLNEYAQRWPAVRIEYYDAFNDATMRREMQRVAQKYNTQAASFPCIEICGRFIVGFQGEEITGRQIEEIFKDRSPRDTQSTTQSQGTPASSIAAHLRWLLPMPLLAVTIEEPMVLPDEVPMDTDSLALPDELSSDAQSEEPGDKVGTAVNAPIDEQEERGIDLPWFGRVRVSEMGMPLFTLVVGLVDGFNPCAMWVLVFLLSVLVNVKDRRRIVVIAGTFVVISGLAYFTFMAAWFNVFQLIGLLRPVQIALGCLAVIVGLVNVKDFFAFHQGLTFSIPESAKPGIYRRVREIVTARNLSVALFGAMTLAVAVNVVELLCTAGLPALYTEVLSLQNWPWWIDYSYLALYIAAYMFDDTVLLTIVVITLSHRKLQEREGRYLKLVSGTVILLLGCVMLVRPSWLV